MAGLEPSGRDAFTLASGIDPSTLGPVVQKEIRALNPDLPAYDVQTMTEALLYGISPVDSLTFAGVSVVLTIVVLAACWIPGRRAARIDPLRAIREV